MHGFAFRKHTVFEWQGAQHRIERLQPNGDILLERLDSGQLVLSNRTELLQAYASGSLSAMSPVSGGSASAAENTLYKRPLSDLKPKALLDFERRKAYVQGILAYGSPIFTPTFLIPLIQEVAAKRGDAKPPSVPTLWRWIRRYQRTGDFRALISRDDLRGFIAPQQSARLLTLAEEAITEAHQLSRRTTVTVIQTILQGKVDQENLSRHNGPGLLIMPSLRTLYRLMHRMEAYEAFSLRNGKAEADRKFRILTGKVTTRRILERVECDHTVLDLFLIDERTQLPLGRPTLTVCIDHYSKMPLGYYLSYQAPSIAAVMGALRHAILPKMARRRESDSIRSLRPQHAWACHGLPQVLVVDNGLEFHSDALQSVAMDLGMSVLFCPKYQPWFKGSVERFLGSISRRFLHTLPGTSFSRWHHRGDYDPLKHAVLTLGEFTQMFEKWLLDDYAQTVHRTTKETPWARWHEGLKSYEPTLPRDRHTLAQRIGQVSQRKLQREGILLEGIRYSGPELLPLLRAHGPGIEVRIVFDPDDLGEIHVWGPGDANPIAVRALDWDYANGLTQFQNQLIRKIIAERGASQTNLKARQEARLAIIDMMREQVSSRKLSDRKRAAKLQGISSRQPKQPTASSPRPQPQVMPSRATLTNASAAPAPSTAPPTFADSSQDFIPPKYALLRSVHDLKGNKERL